MKTQLHSCEKRAWTLNSGLLGFFFNCADHLYSHWNSYIHYFRNKRITIWTPVLTVLWHQKSNKSSRMKPSLQEFPARWREKQYDNNLLCVWIKIKTTDMGDIKKKLKRKSKKKLKIYFYFPRCLMIIHKKFKNIRRGIWNVEDKNKLIVINLYVP